MALPMEKSKTFEFCYETCTTGETFRIKIPLTIPFKDPIREQCHRIMSAFKIPIFLEQEILNQFESSIKQWTLEFYDEKADKVLSDAKSGSLDVEEVIKRLEKEYKDKTVEYAEPCGTTDEELFAAAYHRLVHSPSLEPILQAEHKFGKEVTEVVQQRNFDYEKLTKK